MKARLTVNCGLCATKHEAEIELPHGWELRYDGIDEENGFCPSHSIIAEWADSQCPGCVGGWRECDLWRDFAYNKRGLSDSDLNTIRRGICPRRTNGTFMMDSSGVHDADLSEQANTASGEALAKAIIDYWEYYGVPTSPENRA